MCAVYVRVYLRRSLPWNMSRTRSTPRFAEIIDTGGYVKLTVSFNICRYSKVCASNNVKRHWMPWSTHVSFVFCSSPWRWAMTWTTPFDIHPPTLLAYRVVDSHTANTARKFSTCWWGYSSRCPKIRIGTGVVWAPVFTIREFRGWATTWISPHGNSDTEV